MEDETCPKEQLLIKYTMSIVYDMTSSSGSQHRGFPENRMPDVAFSNSSEDTIFQEARSLSGGKGPRLFIWTFQTANGSQVGWLDGWATCPHCLYNHTDLKQPLGDDTHMPSPQNHHYMLLLNLWLGEKGCGQHTLLLVLVTIHSDNSVLVMRPVVDGDGAALEYFRLEGPGAGGAIDDKVAHALRNQLSRDCVQLLASGVREPEGVAGNAVSIGQQPVGSSSK